MKRNKGLKNKKSKHAKYLKLSFVNNVAMLHLTTNKATTEGISLQVHLQLTKGPTFFLSRLFLAASRF